MKKIKAMLLAATLSMVCLSGCSNETVGASGSETTTLAPIEVDYNVLGRVTDENGNVVEDVPESGETTSTDDENASGGNGSTSNPDASSGTSITRPSSESGDNGSANVSSDEEDEDEGDAFTEFNKENGSSVATESSTEIPAPDETEAEEESKFNVFEDIYEGELTKKEMLELVNKATNSIGDKDNSAVSHYTNIALAYYLETGEWLTDEELAKLYNDMLENVEEGETPDKLTSLGNQNLWAYVFLNQYTDEELNYGEPVELTDEEIAQYKGFIKLVMKEDAEYDIESAYKIPFVLPENESFMDGEEPYLLLVETNGIWKLDVCVSNLYEILDMEITVDSDGNPQFDLSWLEDEYGVTLT